MGYMIYPENVRCPKVTASTSIESNAKVMPSTFIIQQLAIGVSSGIVQSLACGEFHCMTIHMHSLVQEGLGGTGGHKGFTSWL